MSRPDADAALAAVAPGGVLAAKHVSVLDVRCRCGQLLVRLLRTPGGLLAVARRHNPPTRAQLQAKAAGQWRGGGQSEALVVKDDRGTRIAGPLATQVGWWDAPAWLDEDGPGVPLGVHVLEARCACGRRLSGQPGEVLAFLQSGVATRLRSVEAPEHLLRVSSDG